MSTCTFFGHRTVMINIEDILQSTIIDLIENHGVDRFYVGHQGNFDHMVRKTLDKLTNRYSFQYAVVLAYMPKEKSISDDLSPNTILPEGIELVPPRFAISWRNRWMIDQSDYVVTYITNRIGSGAAQFKELAERKKKTVINIGEPK